MEPVVIGGTYRWYAAFKRNVVAGPYPILDLTGATITLNFVPPSGSATHATASIVVAADGTADYTNLAALFNAVGIWKRSWKVVEGSVVLESKLREFEVFASGAAAA